MLWLFHHPPPNATIPALWPLSYRGVIYITDCASPPGITSIVFLFHPSLSWLLCSSLERHHSCLGFPSPKKFQSDLSLSSPPPSPLSPSFSDGLSQGQEFRVVCLPQNRAEDIWWTAVGCDCGLRCAPTGSGGIYWRSWLLVSFCGPEMSAKSTAASAFCYRTQQIILTNSDGSSCRTLWKTFKTTPLTRIIPRWTFQLCCSSSGTLIEQSNNQNPPADIYMHTYLPERNV